MAETTSESLPKIAIPLTEVDGLVFPTFFETNRPMKEQLECIKALEMKADDVIICAYAKAGTHWIWEVVSMLLSGKAEYEKRSKEFAMMEATEIENIQNQPSPRILNTHIPVDMLPSQVKAKKVKLIHIYRNIKDVMVSLYFHGKQNPGMENFTIDNWFDQFLVHTGMTNQRGAYVPFLLTMDKFIKDNPDHPVFNISFEDAKEDPLSAVRRLAEFLGVKVSPQLCEEIAEATSFSKLKEASINKDEPGHLPKVQMYRKGEVGDWKNHLSDAQSKLLDRMTKELEGCDFRFRYDL